MTLNYRGLKYNTNTSAERPAPPKGLCYRGVAINSKTSVSNQVNVHHALKYRGMSYAV